MIQFLLPLLALGQGDCILFFDWKGTLGPANPPKGHFGHDSDLLRMGAMTEIQHKTINKAFLTFVQEPYNCEIYVIDSGNVSELLLDGKANPIHPFFLQYDHILTTKGVEGPKEERKWTVMKEIVGERKDYSNVFFIDHKLKYIEVADKHLPMQNNIYVEGPITMKTTQYPHLEELLQKLASKYNSGHFSPTEAPKKEQDMTWICLFFGLFFPITGLLYMLGPEICDFVDKLWNGEHDETTPVKTLNDKECTQQKEHIHRQIEFQLQQLNDFEHTMLHSSILKFCEKV